VKADVKWEYENPSLNNIESGVSELTLTFKKVGIQGSQLAGHGRGPVVEEETEKDVSSRR
jgi:hypothetical protein